MYRQEDHPDEKERETNSRRRGSPMALMKKAIRKRLSVQHPAGFITARAHASPPISIPARARARARGETRDEHLCIKSPRFSFFPRWKPSETATRPTDLSGDQNSTSLPPPGAARPAGYETDPFFFFPAFHRGRAAASAFFASFSPNSQPAGVSRVARLVIGERRVSPACLFEGQRLRRAPSGGSHRSLKPLRDFKSRARSRETRQASRRLKSINGRR
jgi:hypothetical protein